MRLPTLNSLSIRSPEKSSAVAQSGQSREMVRCPPNSRDQGLDAAALSTPNGTHVRARTSCANILGHGAFPPNRGIRG